MNETYLLVREIRISQKDACLILLVEKKAVVIGPFLVNVSAEEYVPIKSQYITNAPCFDYINAHLMLVTANTAPEAWYRRVQLDTTIRFLIC